MANDLGRLNDILFDELDRLQDADACDGSGRAGLDVEIARARSIRDLAATVIDNANTTMRAVELKVSLSDPLKPVSLPRLLDGDAE